METRHETILITHFDEIEESKKHWKSFLSLGIVMMVLGLLGIGAAPFLTLFSTIIVGLILLCGGISQITHSFWARKWSGLFLSLLAGVLYAVTGLVCIAKPAISATNLTLVMSAFFFIGGIFRILNALTLRFNRWGWAVIHGIITTLLGAIIFSEWPYSGMWVIGLFIGIDLFLVGWFTTLLSLAARKKA